MKYTVEYFDGSKETVDALWPKGARENCSRPKEVLKIHGPQAESLGSKLMKILIDSTDGK